MNKQKKWFLIAIGALALIVIIALLSRKRGSTKGLSEIFQGRADVLDLDLNEIYADTEKVKTATGTDIFWDSPWMPFEIPVFWEDEITIVNVLKKYDSIEKLNLFIDIYDRRFKTDLRKALFKYLSPSDIRQIPSL